MKSEEKNISIIIPHYNSVQLLIKLLKTIPEQPDIQVLIVDDNSTDSLDEAKQYIENRAIKNIDILFNDTGKKGAGVSRNIGLNKANGKWLLFADADDYFLQGWYDIVLPYLNSDYDMVYFSPTSIDIRTNKISSRHIMYSELVEKYYKKRSQRSLLELKYCFCTPWSKLIRRKIVEDNCIFFDEVPASNDIMFITKTAFNSQTVECVMNEIYCVTRGGSSLTSKRDKSKFMSRIEVLVNRYTYLRNNLSKREFKMVHMDRYALGKLVDIVLEKWGIKTFLEVVSIYRRNRIAIWDWGLFNPYTLFHKAKIELSWWWDIKKNRK